MCFLLIEVVSAVSTEVVVMWCRDGSGLATGSSTNVSHPRTGCKCSGLDFRGLGPICCNRFQSGLEETA